MNSENFKVFLQNEYTKRKVKNPQYSLRAFARSLNIPSGRLSEILRGKRSITPTLFKKLLEGFQIDMMEKEKLKTTFNLNLNAKKSTLDDSHFFSIQDELFDVISDWHHFAILNLAVTLNFQSDFDWIADRLNTKSIYVQMATERLIRTGLLRKDSKGKFIPTHKNIKTSDQIVNRALRLAHKNSMEKAIESLETIEVKDRDISAIVMPVNIDKIPEAKKLIKSFRRKMAKLLETGSKQEVYALNVQLIPITKLRREK